MKNMEKKREKKQYVKAIKKINFIYIKFQCFKATNHVHKRVIIYLMCFDMIITQEDIVSVGLSLCHTHSFTVQVSTTTPRIMKNRCV